jgi:predicted permease
MDTLLQDIRYALRLLSRNPAFTAIAVLALALGIGANSAIFSIVNAVVLKPLPYNNPEQLVQLWMRFTNIGIPNDQNWVSVPEFMDLKQNGSFSHIAAIDSGSYNVNLGATPERIESAIVSTDFFPMLGVQARTGRVFSPDEGRPGQNRVVLLSDGLWRRRFAADPNVIGQKLIMNGDSYVVVGVLPGDFRFPRDAEVWTPLVFSANDLSENSRGNHGLQVIARIKPGMSVAQARADMAGVSQRIIEQHPSYPYKTYNFSVITIPLLDQQVGDMRTALWVLMGAVGLVLLIACANVANLLLVRAAGRGREVAVRVALGVSRWRLVRQLLTESAVLGLVGGVCGLALGYWALQLLVTISATSFPRVVEARMDLRVLLFTLGVSLFTGVVFGLAPALQVIRHTTFDALKEGGRSGSSGMASTNLRSALVIAEVAISLTLLVGAGLLIRSFLRLQEVDSGFRPEGVLTMRLSLPDKYAKAEQTRTFFRELLERVRRLPGVDAAGAVTGLPLSGSGWSGTATVDTQAVSEQDRSPEADQRPVTPGYFEAMGITLIRGRFFDQRDNETTAPVAIVDETMARTYWPNEDAIGKRIKGGDAGSPSPWFSIVGVVRHVRYRTLESPSRTEFYWPLAQTPFPLTSMSLAIHTQADPYSLAAAVQQQVQSIDPDQPIYRIRTMNELVSESSARRRLSMLLLVTFAGVALLLAAVGIYGVMSYSVAQRVHEIGIRMALGARSTEIVRLVLGQSMWMTLAGVGAGVVGSLAVTTFLSTLLFNVRATDPTTFVLVAVILTAVALFASFLPAFRATRVDPVRALREE